MKRATTEKKVGSKVSEMIICESFLYLKSVRASGEFSYRLIGLDGRENTKREDPTNIIEFLLLPSSVANTVVVARGTKRK